MTSTSPETHLLRELHVLSSPVVVLVGLATATLWGAQIAPRPLFGMYISLFVVAAATYGVIAILRARKLNVQIRAWSALVSGLVNATAIGSILLAFRVWYFQWPLNREPIQPEDYIDDGGATTLIAVGLAVLGSLIWVLGVFAVGATPTKRTREVEPQQ